MIVEEQSVKSATVSGCDCVSESDCGLYSVRVSASVRDNGGVSGSNSFSGCDSTVIFVDGSSSTYAREKEKREGKEENEDHFEDAEELKDENVEGKEKCGTQ